MNPPHDRGEVGEKDPHYIPDPYFEALKWPSNQAIDWLNKYFPLLPEPRKKYARNKVAEPKEPLLGDSTEPQKGEPL